MKNDELRIMNYGSSDNARVDSQIRTFTDLRAWREGHQLVLQVYEITKAFPSHEIFGLVSQLRRAVVSITSNVAEGFSRQSYSEKVQFYSIAHGSVTEVQNQLLIARDVGYITNEVYDATSLQSVTVHKILSGLIRASKEKRNS